MKLDRKCYALCRRPPRLRGECEAACMLSAWQEKDGVSDIALHSSVAAKTKHIEIEREDL